MRTPPAQTVTTGHPDAVDRDTRTISALQRAREAKDAAQAATLRETVIHENIALAHSIAGRYANRGVDLEDLQQVAALALVLAAGRFDPERGSNFTSYAGPTIHGELKRHLRDHAWAVRPPRGLHDTYHEVLQARRALAQSLGGEPSAQDIAAHLEIAVSTVLEAQRLGYSYTAASLEALTAQRPDVPVGTALTCGTVEDTDAGLVGVLLDQGLGAPASSRDRLLLRLRFEQDLTQQEIGARLGLSQMQVSRLLSAILARLRTSLADDIGTAC